MSSLVQSGRRELSGFRICQILLDGSADRDRFVSRRRFRFSGLFHLPSQDDGPFPTLCLDAAPLVVAFHNALCPHGAGASFPVPLSGLRTSRIVTTIEGQHDLYRTDIVQSIK